jgi:hypothetical protein
MRIEGEGHQVIREAGCGEQKIRVSGVIHWPDVLMLCFPPPDHLIL